MAATSSKLQNITDSNRFQKLSSLTPSDLKSQQDWTIFFEQLALLRKRAESSGDMSLKKNIYQMIRNLYPHYQLSQQTRQACQKRTQLVWDKIKNLPEFEEGIYKYTYGDKEEKTQGIFKLATAMEKACSSFYTPKNFRVVVYDSKSKPEFASSGGFYNTGLKRIYFGTPDNGFTVREFDEINVNSDKIHSAGHLLNTLYHEMTHAMQSTIANDSHDQYTEKYVDPQFSALLKAFEPVYVSNNSLKQDLQKIRQTDPSFATDYQQDYLAYMNNPQEQESFLAGNLINVLANNWMRGRGVRNINVTFDYRLKGRYHFPFSSDGEICDAFGEKMTQEKSDNRHILSRDFWDKKPLNTDPNVTDINPYHHLESARKYYNLHLKNPNNASLFLKSVQYNLNALHYSRDINGGPSSQVFEQLRTLLSDKNMNNYPKLKKRIINVFNRPPAHTDTTFLSTLTQQKQLLDKQIDLSTDNGQTNRSAKTSLIRHLKFCQTALPTPSCSNISGKKGLAADTLRHIGTSLSGLLQSNEQINLPDGRIA